MHLETKSCKVCGESKSLSLFPRDKRMKGGRRNQCKTCWEQQKLKYEVNRKRSSRERQLMMAYGITLADYDRMFQEQHGRCAICGSEDPGKHKSEHLCVDHDHETGKVRGLLCHPCNRGLGLFKDNTNSLAAAIQYLSR